jgi:hypothetical protein
MIIKPKFARKDGSNISHRTSLSYIANGGAFFHQFCTGECGAKWQDGVLRPCYTITNS